MNENKFVINNSKTWSDLENTLAKLKHGGLKKFDKNELDNFINLYNRTCGHLSYCRTYLPNTATAGYLNRLVASAHGSIYTTKTSSLRRFIDFFRTEFPALLRKNAGYFILSALLFMLGFILSFIFTLNSPDNAAAFLPQNVIDSINFKGDSGSRLSGTLMSSFIFTNNIKVGFIAFALGITLGVGTFAILLSNGYMLGTIAALAYHSHVSLKFWSLILPHGILELFAIFTCGAAGLIIGYSIINPGIYTRKDSFIMRGKLGVKLVCGTLPIFVEAGLIEGFVTPSALGEVTKLMVALFTLVVLAVYLLRPWFHKAADADSGNQ